MAKYLTKAGLQRYAEGLSEKMGGGYFKKVFNYGNIPTDFASKVRSTLLGNASDYNHFIGVASTSPNNELQAPNGDFKYMREYGPSLIFGVGDTHAMLSFNYYKTAYPITIAYGNKNNFVDFRQIAMADSNVASATKLYYARKIAGHAFDGTEDISISASDVGALPADGEAINAMYYGVTNTMYTLTTKVVSISNFKLTKGAHVFIKFVNGNFTKEFSLNINNTGAIPVETNTFSWAYNTTHEFVYSGESFIHVDNTSTIEVTGQLSSPGWYRVANLHCCSGSAIIMIDRFFNTSPGPRTDVLQLAMGYGDGYINEICANKGVGIDKVRFICYQKTSYLEVHYSLQQLNSVYVTIIPSAFHARALSAVNFEAGEVPDGYNVTELELCKYPGGMKASVFDGGATSLYTPRLINGTSFDGTSNINLDNYYKFQFSKNYETTQHYRGFCKMQIPTKVGTEVSHAMFLLTGIGSYNGDNQQSTFLVECNTRTETYIRAVELMPTASNKSRVEFGYWVSGNYVIFGLKHGFWNYEINVMPLGVWNSNASIVPEYGVMYDSSTKPTGWTSVAYDIVATTKSTD